MSISTVRRAADALLQAITEAGPDDPRWATAGPLVSAAADRLRQALGCTVRGSSIATPPVVREADLAQAARPLLTAAALVSPAAAREFVRLAAEATHVLCHEPELRAAPGRRGARPPARTPLPARA